MWWIAISSVSDFYWLDTDGTIAVGGVTSTDGGASNGEKEIHDSSSNGGEKKAGVASGQKRERENVSGDGNGSATKKKKVASTSKHPLRQAGMKPGEGCFLCKSKDHIAKHCPTKSEKDRHKVKELISVICQEVSNVLIHRDSKHFESSFTEIPSNILCLRSRCWYGCLQMCLGCRMWGHTLKNCPSEFKGTDSKLCYNCGEPGHSLDKCLKPLKDGKYLYEVSCCSIKYVCEVRTEYDVGDSETYAVLREESESLYLPIVYITCASGSDFAGGSTFAECFLCKERGHLSKNCPENKHGIYPKVKHAFLTSCSIEEILSDE